MFVKNHFVKQLVASGAYKRQDYKQALINNFLKMDRMLLSKKGKQEIRELIEHNKADDPDGDSQKDRIDASNQDGEIDEWLIGCTANVVLITPLDIYCANAGDCRAVMCYQGHAIDLSKDHKPEDKLEKERIYKTGAELIGGRINGTLNVSRAIGDFDLKQQNPDKNVSPSWFKHHHTVTAYPDITVNALTDEVELILIGCDGIWNSRSSQQCIKYYR